MGEIASLGHCAYCRLHIHRIQTFNRCRTK
jgi:hypothetical protein